MNNIGERLISFVNWTTVISKLHVEIAISRGKMIEKENKEKKRQQ